MLFLLSTFEVFWLIVTEQGIKGGVVPGEDGNNSP